MKREAAAAAAAAKDNNIFFYYPSNLRVQILINISKSRLVVLLSKIMNHRGRALWSAGAKKAK